MFIGNIKHDAISTKIKLSCVSSAPHSRIFWVVGSSISTARTTVRNWTVSLIPRFHKSVAVMCKVFRSLTSHRKLVYSIKTCSCPFRVLGYFCFIPRLNFLVSYSSDPSPGIFFVCKHEGRPKDPRCENWNCQLLARFLRPLMKIQIVFRKLLQYRNWSCFSLSNKWLYLWLLIARHCYRRLFRLFLAFTANN